MASRRILVIDDDRAIVTLLSTVLSAAGFEVSVAFDGAQGFRLATNDPPDLILLDLNMPTGGGVGTWQQLRGSARTQGVPVFFVTGDAQPGLEQEVLRQGVAGFVEKPFDAAALVERVQRFLEAR